MSAPDRVVGWKAIAAELGVSIPTAWRMAHLDWDPCPVYRLRGSREVFAFASALRDWHMRSVQHVVLAERLGPARDAVEAGGGKAKGPTSDAA